MKGFVLNIVLFFWSALAFSQTLNTHFSESHIQLGERVVITFSIRSEVPIEALKYEQKKNIFPAKTRANGTVQSISVPFELEILSAFRDTVYEEKGSYIWKGFYEVTGWDSAFVIVTPEKIMFNDSVYSFPAALLEIESPQVDPIEPIKDIDEAFTDIPEVLGFIYFLKENALILVGIGLMLLLVLFLLSKRRNRNKPLAQLSLREQILNEIDQLEHSKLYEENLKEYYVQLSTIVRRFFSIHFSERMMDKTSLEIELLLAQRGLEENTIQVIKKILNQADLVKFAKSEPPVSEVYKITNDARRVVHEVADLSLNDA